MQEERTEIREQEVQPTSEVPPTTTMEKELRQWGAGLLIMGVLHFVLSNLLDPIWGIVLLIVGSLNLLIHHPGMFIVNGLALIAVGLLNILGTLAAGGTGFAIFGVWQIGWGMQELKKFTLYKNAVRSTVSV